MLHRAKNTRRCTWGCCGDNPPSRTLRTRERNAWKRALRRGEA